ncbi:NAD(P)/FAD-dependent oxidoreductase [Christiangramia forsetii]|uniref:FAD-dependent pyridine nucleotide-disulfide oxidoreductase n=2 Tax=Christiangramia forsetii TaxID=411153 RepID=A0M7F9_CHRFK|nr:NAD(P)/FAD-dependent oxidoreductase [Christiangramia forsetii]GGG28007.1 FAD-dependent oxidoreductase [Christiangramia forsetii]CAL68554.1 FAD-dependent pyridine nucleotide-disulfide oxidoreductase [Christiangramia forsetii KT0803]
MSHIVIIGNGISGITAARHIRKRSDHRITVVSGESDYFFSRTALMYVYMGHMKWDHLKPYEDWFWEKNRIELKKAWVEQIDFKKKKLRFSSGEPLEYDKLVIATGSVYNKFGWEGQDLKGVQGLVTKQDLIELEENTPYTKKAVIIGGGLIGVELAEMLRTRKIEVTFLVREKAFWSSVLPLPNAKLISDHIKSHGVDLRHNTELDKILSDENGRVRAVKTKDGKEIDCQLVGLCAGVRPNIDFLKDSDLETDKGILVNEFLETNIPDVYSIGDCAQQKTTIGLRKPVEAVWYTGRIMGETLAYTLTGERTAYQPGNWFNSAKFFDIEYQTYGWVWPRPKNNEQHFHWQHESGLKAITISYNSEINEFLGVNTFGIRMRQEVINLWLDEHRKIDHVLANLKLANFDPEFYDRHEKEIFRSFKNNLEKAY